MKKYGVFMVLALGLVSAAQAAIQAEPPVPVIVPPATAVPQGTTLLPRAIPVPEGVPTQTFICGDGTAAEAVQQEAAGVLHVSRQGESFVLFQEAGANPPRYAAREGTVIVRDGLVVITRPHHKVVLCYYRPETPVAGLLWGTITKKDRSALPEGTKAKVFLVDLSRADAPALEIASTEIITVGNQTPLSFLIRYNPNRISEPRAGKYGLQVRMTDARGRLTYITNSQLPLFAEGLAQAPVEVEVVPAPQAE